MALTNEEGAKIVEEIEESITKLTALKEHFKAELKDTEKNPAEDEKPKGVE